MQRYVPYPGGSWMLSTILFFFTFHFLFRSWFWGLILLVAWLGIKWVGFLILASWDLLEENRVKLYSPYLYGLLFEPVVGLASLFYSWYLVDKWALDNFLDFVDLEFLVLEFLLYVLIIAWPSDHFTVLLIIMVTPFYTTLVSLVNGALWGTNYVIWTLVTVVLAAFFLVNFGWHQDKKRLKGDFRDDYIFTIRGTYLLNTGLALSFIFMFTSFLAIVS